jgi:hypothetical protein
VPAPPGAPASAAEAPETPGSGRRSAVVGVDSYGQASAQVQPAAPSVGQPPVPATPQNPAAPVNVAPPSNLPPSDVPQGPPSTPVQPMSPQFQ